MSVYYRPKQSGRTLDLMKRLDALYTENPTYGARRMCAALRNAGVTIGRYKVRRLMEKMGLEAIYRKSKLSAPHPGHTVYPYLLRGVKSTR
jgi:putative transposase